MNANDKPASPPCSDSGEEENSGSGPEELSSEEGCLRPSLHFDAQKAQFCPEEGCESPSDERHRGDNLYPRCGAQPSGAFGGPHQRRSREGSAGRKVPYYPGDTGFSGCSGPETESIEVRDKKAKVADSLSC